MDTWRFPATAASACYRGPMVLLLLVMKLLLLLLLMLLLIVNLS